MVAHGPTCLADPRPSAQVWEPLEYSLQALDSDSSLLLPLPLLRGHVRLRRLGHRPTGNPAFPFLWTSWKIIRQRRINQREMGKMEVVRIYTCDQKSFEFWKHVTEAENMRKSANRYVTFLLSSC